MHKGDFWGLFGICLGRCPGIIPKKISFLQFYSRFLCFFTNALALHIYMIYVLIWLYTMYCGKTLNTLKPVMVTINKLWQKMNVSCFQDISILQTLQSSVTLIAVVRERRLTYYNFIILLMYFKYFF